MGSLRFGWRMGEWSSSCRYSSTCGPFCNAQSFSWRPGSNWTLTAGVLAAIMSSLDSQFLCLGTIFTNDIVIHRAGKNKYSDKQIIFIARCFIVAIVALTYGLAMLAKDANVFDLGSGAF